MIPSPTRKPHAHLRRIIRDGRGRALGYCCLECGDLVAEAKLPRSELWLLEACSLILLKLEEEGELELTGEARRTLQARRRRLVRLRNRGKLRAELREKGQR